MFFIHFEKVIFQQKYAKALKILLKKQQQQQQKKKKKKNSGPWSKIRSLK